MLVKSGPHHRGYVYGERKASIPEFSKDDGKLKLVFHASRYTINSQYAQVDCGCLDMIPNTLSIFDPATAAAGLLKRMASVNHNKSETIADFRSSNRMFFRKNLTPLPPINIRRDFLLLFEEWVKTTNYSQSRIAELRKCLDKFIQNPTWLSQVLDELFARKEKQFSRLTRKIIGIRSFIKNEFYEFSKYARTINSRSDTFKALAGYTAKAMEHVVYDLSSPIGKHFIKHVPDHHRSKYIMEHVYHPGGFYAQTDFSSFENTIGYDQQQACEMQLYQWLLRDSPDALALMQAQLTKNSLNFRNFSIKMRPMRMSGELTTSLGNGITNMCVIRYMLHIDNIKEERYVVEGDDGLIWVPHKFSPQALQAARDLGFKLKINYTTQINEASFCGKIFDTTNHITITDPFYLLAASGYTENIGKISNARASMVTACKGYSMIYAYANCPIVACLGDRFIRTSGITVDQIKPWLARQRMDSFKSQTLFLALDNVPKNYLDVPFTTRILFEKVYGITIDFQLLIEKEIKDGVGWFHSSLVNQIAPTSMVEKLRDQQLHVLCPSHWILNYSKVVPCSTMYPGTVVPKVLVLKDLHVGQELKV